MTTATPKPPRAKKPTPAEIAARIHQTAIDLAPNAAPELLFVPVDRIDTRDQVRTEISDETLAELAADIGLRGILQPVLLRPLEDGRYLMIAGHRRLMAARLAGLAAVPALAGQLDDEAAEDMQLAENIQREDLSLADEARAVRRLFDRLGSLQAVADRVKKSKPWVSKRVSLSAPELNYLARQLLDQGVCEDIETLLALSKTAALDYGTGKELAELIANGKAGRQTARDYITKAQAAVDGRKAEWEAQREQRERERETNRADYERQADEREAQRQANLEAFWAEVPDPLKSCLAVLLKKFDGDREQVEDYIYNALEYIERSRNHEHPED